MNSTRNMRNKGQGASLLTPSCWHLLVFKLQNTNLKTLLRAINSSCIAHFTPSLHVQTSQNSGLHPLSPFLPNSLTPHSAAFRTPLLPTHRNSSSQGNQWLFIFSPHTIRSLSSLLHCCPLFPLNVFSSFGCCSTISTGFPSISLALPVVLSNNNEHNHLLENW